jgi:MFS family permease
MWIAFFLNYCDRQVVFSIYPILRSELHFSDVQLGLTGSVFLWIYGLFNPVAGQIGDKYSKRKLVVLSLVVWSGATLLTGFCRSPESLLFLRAVIGLAEAFFYPAAFTLTANAHRPETRSRALAVFGTAQIVGTIGGGWFGGYMAEKGDWRLAFYALGIVGFLYAIPYVLFMKQVAEDAAVETRKSGSAFAMLALVKVPTYLVLCLAFPTFVFVQWLLNGWLSNFLQEKFALGLADAAFTATAYVQGATLVGVLSGGVLADWLYHRTKAARYWLVAGGLLLCAPCIHFIGNSQSLLETKIAAVIFGLSGGFFIANVMASTLEVVPADTRASAVGTLNMVGGIVAGFGTLFGGLWKKTLGINNLLTLAALACFVAGILVLLAIKYLFRRDYDRVH